MPGNLFLRQFDLLKKELDLIDGAIRQIDDITKGIKNWAIVTWTASVGVSLASNELKTYVWLTAFIPILFWLLDASYRRVQRTFIGRNREIREFINSDDFKNAAISEEPFDFKLLEMRTKSNDWKDKLLGVMVFRTVWVLYGGLSLLSIIVWIVVINCT
jgi:hypothetical protein